MSIWETDISIEKVPYLADHCVQGSIVVPATAYMEMATAAARDLFGETAIRLSDLSFKRPLVLSAGIVHSAQVSLSPISADSAAVHLYSRHAGGESAWNLLFTATVTKSAGPPAEVEATGFEAFAGSAPCQIGAAEFYDHFRAQGNQWGPTFRGVVNAWVGAEEAWSRVEIPATLQSETELYWAHPAVADACGHVLSAINAFGGDATARRGALVGQGVESVTIWQRPQGTALLCHARVRRGSEPNILLGDVRVFDEAGRLVSDLVGARLHYLEAETAESRPENWLYRVAWRETPRLEGAGPGRTQWIILADTAGVGQALAGQMRSVGASCLLLTSRGEEACAAVKAATRRGDGSTAVICLWGLDVAVSEGAEGDQAIREIVHLGGVPEMLRAFTGAQLSETRVWLVTSGAQSCERAGRPVAFWQTPVWSLGRTFSSEHPELWGGLLDIDPQAGVEANAGALWSALCAGGNEDQVALRGDRRLSARLERQSVRAAASLPFRSDGCYLITGGLGGLGLEVARWMVRSGARRLILMSRTALPPRDAWRDMNPEDSRTAAIKAILALEQEGAVVHTASVDVADRAAVSTFVENWERECQPPIRGVVHAAGTLRHGFIAELSSADFEAMVRPKLGAWFLHEALERMPLDFFVLFSSASSILSSAKLGGYAAANALLDGLAAYRNQLGKPCLSINWGMWIETGMSMRFAASDIQALAEHGMGGLPTAHALEFLASLICSDGQTAVLPVDWRRWAARYPAYAAVPFLSSILDSPAIETAAPRDASARRRILDSPEPDRRQVLLSYLTGTLEKVLGFPPGAADPSTPLSQLGMDSLMGLEFKHQVDADLGVSLAMVRVLEGLPLEALAPELLEAMGRESRTGPATGTAEPPEALLAKIDELTEDELDAALSSIMSEGGET
jgi:NAD(P)-dependent dehydrogenase (short-subunit alcohol dehydrogenase family)